MIKNAIPFLIVLWVSSATAYPWMFLREKDSSEILTADSHISYFPKKKDISVLSNLSVNYNNPMTDVDLGYSYSYLEKKHYFRFSELSVAFPFLWKNWKINIGFKDTLWSEADRYWNYGLWQARYLLDPLRPMQMGMPGLHWSYSDGAGSSFLLSLSYLHLPDIVILPQLSNNKLFSNNPLFNEEIPFQVKKLTPLFQLENFFKPSLAALFTHQLSPLSVHFAYAWKPMNQAQKAFKLNPINISEDSSKLSIKELSYFFLPHHLISLETELELFEKASLFASLFYEKPEKLKSLEPEWLTDNFSPHFTFSILAYFQEKWANQQNTLFTIGYTKTDEFTLPEKANPLTKDMKETLNRNFDWKEAVSASIEYENKRLYEGLIFRLRSLYALDNRYYQLALEAYVHLNSYFRIYGSSDLFFRLSEETVRENSSSIKRYKHSNRFLIGGQYVF